MSTEFIKLLEEKGFESSEKDGRYFLDSEGDFSLVDIIGKENGFSVNYRHPYTGGANYRGEFDKEGNPLNRGVFSNLFKIKKYHIGDYKSWYTLTILNKNLTRFINFFFGMPYGRKKGKLETPKILNLLNNKEIYEKYLWRGIFDSDAMISPAGRNIEMASSDFSFMIECKSFLSKINIQEKIKKGIDGKKGKPYYYINIRTRKFKKFGINIGSSHPRKQNVMVKHLQRKLQDYTFKGINKKNMDKENFNLDIINRLLYRPDKRINLPKKINKKIINIAKEISPFDWEKKRIFFKKENRKRTQTEILNKFEKIFNLKPKFLKTRNMHYINSHILHKFFNLYFIYEKSWKPISKKEADNLLQKWNSIFKNGN